MGLVKREVRPWDGAQRRTCERDTAGLIAQLSEQNPEARRRAALDLCAQRDAIPALLAAYSTEHDPAAREAMLIALAEHDDPDVASAFTSDLRAEDPAVRNTAVTALWSMPNAVADLLDGLLDDPQERVRILSMTVLTGVEDPRVPLWLDRVVRTDPSENVVAAAVDTAIAAVGNPYDLLQIALQRFPTNPYLGCLADTLGDSS